MIASAPLNGLFFRASPNRLFNFLGSDHMSGISTTLKRYLPQK